MYIGGKLVGFYYCVLVYLFVKGVGRNDISFFNFDMLSSDIWMFFIFGEMGVFM